MDNTRLPASATDYTLDNRDLQSGLNEKTGHFLRGVWRLCDPKISLASLSSIFLGTCIAATAGPIHWGWLGLTVAGIICLEAAKNASGEIFDYEADVAVADEDVSPFSGGKRVIVDGLLTENQTKAVAAFFYLHGIAAGLAIFLFREPLILGVGMIGVCLAYFYNAPPARLSYRGFGEIAVAITYGPLILSGTYLVQQNKLPLEVSLISIPLGILISAFLVINEFPDRKADLAAGKKNLVVRLGENSSEWLFTAMIFAAYILLLALPLAGISVMVRIGIIGLPFAIAAAIRLMQTKETAKLIAAQRWAMFSFVLAALGSGIGLLLG